MSKPSIGSPDEYLARLTARQWEAIAAAQQERLFAIHDLAEAIAIHGSGFAVKKAEAIQDLCHLSHRELTKKGLLS